jgi:exodeoxyribonuclease VII large subunit
VKPDVILIGRGGGSIEDLWAFNDEGVVRAVAASDAPVISGVGHETDFTLTDFAADKRAPTPTAAAEIATPDRVELMASVVELANLHTTILRKRLADLRWEQGQLQSALESLSPRHAINTYRQRLDEIILRLDRVVRTRLETKHLKLENLQNALRSLNPQAVLHRGYALVTRERDGKIIKRADQVSVGEGLHIQVSRGSLNAEVKETHQED